jgi:hypothetical protein
MLLLFKWSRNSVFLWKPKFHYHVHKSMEQDPTLNQTNLVHIPTACLLKIYLNIILPSTSRFPIINSTFHYYSTKILYAFLTSHVLYIYHLIPTELLTLIITNGIINYAIYIIIQSFPLSLVQIFLSACCSETPSVFVLLL